MGEDVVRDLRNVNKFEDFIAAGKANQVKWILHTLSALRQPGSRQAMKLGEDATDSELFRAFVYYPDKHRLLLKGGCPLHSTVQAESHVANLYRTTPISAWQREVYMPTGKLDRLLETSIPSRCKRYALLVCAGFFCLAAMALLGLAGWMKWKRIWFTYFNRKWWAYPHGFLGSAILLFISALLFFTNYMLRFRCCRRCCFFSWCCCFCLRFSDLSCCCRRRRQAPTLKLSGSMDTGAGDLNSTRGSRISPESSKRSRRPSIASLLSMGSGVPATSEPGSPGSPSSPKKGLMRRLSGLRGAEDGEQETVDLEGMENIPDVPIPDALTLALVMLSPTKRMGMIPSLRNTASFESTVVPWQEGGVTSLGQTASSFKSVSFEADQSQWEDSMQLNVPTTVSAPVLQASSHHGVPTSPVIDGSMTALWHDQSYTFSQRFARHAARAAAEEPRQTFLKPKSVAKNHYAEGAKKTQLQTMVQDLPVEGVEHELRPHLVQFYQDTIFQSEPNYPKWHPGSNRSKDEKEDVTRCSKKKTRKLFRPLIAPVVAPSPGPEVQPLGGADIYSATARSDTMSFDGSYTRYDASGHPTPVYSDRMVGLEHPQFLDEIDAQARMEALGGQRANSLYGWSTPAGPRFHQGEPPGKGDEEDERGGGDALPDIGVARDSHEGSPRSTGSPGSPSRARRSSVENLLAGARSAEQPLASEEAAADAASADAPGSPQPASSPMLQRRPSMQLDPAPAAEVDPASLGTSPGGRRGSVSGGGRRTSISEQPAAAAAGAARRPSVSEGAARRPSIVALSDGGGPRRPSVSAGGGHGGGRRKSIS